MDMKQVAQTEFWASIGPRDAIGTVVGRWPYTTIYRERHSDREIGRVVSVLRDGRAIPEDNYYLRENAR